MIANASTITVTTVDNNDWTYHSLTDGLLTHIVDGCLIVRDEDPKIDDIVGIHPLKNISAIRPNDDHVEKVH